MYRKLSLILVVIAVMAMISFNSFSIFTAGINEGVLKVYPMPVNTITKITANTRIINIEVYNILGTKVLSRDREGEVDFSNLPSGYYLIKANTESGELIKRVQKN